MTEMITYKQEGDYLIPDLKLPEENEPVGKYGRMRETFLKQNRSSIYTTLLLTGKLHEHLTEIDRTAKEQIEQMVKKMAQTEGVNEELKATDPMEWTGLMNNLTHSAEETVLEQLVFN
ncbi:MAG: TnpV protein [Clostridiales bacterium]|nr:TnpV protein [Clostridiales bacterium]